MMRLYIGFRWLFLGFMFILKSLTYGQSNISFLNLTPEDGLANHQVRMVAKDQKGFIWLATADGLQRFDGYEFQTFQDTTQQSNILNSNIIRAVFVDSQDNVWVGTRGAGLKRYGKGKFETFQHDPKNPESLSQNDIEAIAEDPHGNIWIGTRKGGLCKFRDGKFTHFLPDSSNANSLSHRAVFSLWVDKKGTLWVGTYGGGLNRMNPDGSFTQFRHEPANPNSISGDYIIALTEDKHQNLWIGTWQTGLNKFKNEQFERINPENSGLNSHSVLSIVEDKNGCMWFGTWGGGVNKYENGTFTSFKNRPYDASSLVSNYIEHLFEDEAGTIWVSTFSGGVSRLIQRPFTTFKAHAQPNSLKSEYISGIINTSDGTLWMGTLGGGLNRYQNDKMTIFEHPNEEINSIWCMMADKNGIWLGTNGGLVRFANGQFKRYQLPFDTQNPYDMVYCFHRISEDKILFGTWQGVIYEIAHEQITILHPPKSHHQPIACLLRDSKNRLWVARHENGGLQCLANGKSIVFESDKNQANALIDNSPRALLEDSKNRIWVGSMEGLSLYDEKGGFISYTTDYPKLACTIQSMEEDRFGNLWLSTENGLIQFHPDKKTLKTYTVQDGLAGNVFTFGSSFRDDKGHLYFGSSKGLSILNPAKLMTETPSENIVLIDFQIFNKSVLLQNRFDKPIEEVTEITLDYQENVFTFGFSSLEFINPNLQYQYYLEGFENQYNPPSKRRFATYTNIPYGTYIFRAKRVGGNAELTIKIIIQPPFWERTEFKIFMVMLLILTPLAFYRYRILRIRSQNKTLTKKVRERTRELVKEREVARQKAKKLQEMNEELTSLTEELRQNSEELNTTNQQLMVAEKKLHTLLRKEKQQLKILRNTHNSLIDAQGQLVHSEKMASLGVLTAGIAHEINNPVNFIYAGTEALKSNLDDLTDLLAKYNELDEISATKFEAKIQEIKTLKEELEVDDELISDTLALLKDVQTGATRITEIVKGLRTFSRLDEDTFKLSDVHQNLDSTLVILRNQYKNRVQIIRKYDTQLPAIECYAGKLNQVFMNLIANAIQAIEGEGHIFISTQLHETDFVQIKIRDTGAGIPDDIKNRIFEPFFTTKEVGKGTGLGLSISHGIIEKHHGKISVWSELGKGTEFSIILPFKQPEKAPNA